MNDQLGTAPTARPLDHVVVVVTDLNGAAGRLQGLGFYVTARSDHPFGTSNRLAMLDDSYIELVTVTDRSAVPETGFARFIADALDAGRLGPRLFVFASTDAEADRQRLAGAGLAVAEPLRFGRQASLPDGSAPQVEFVVVLPEFGDLSLGAFVCQHLTPERMWHPSVRDHPNGATRLARIVTSEADGQGWDLISKVGGANGPPMTLPNTVLDEGPSRLVVEGSESGSTTVAGVAVEVVERPL